MVIGQELLVGKLFKIESHPSIPSLNGVLLRGEVDVAAGDVAGVVVGAAILACSVNMIKSKVA